MDWELEKRVRKIENDGASSSATAFWLLAMAALVFLIAVRHTQRIERLERIHGLIEEEKEDGTD